MLDHVNMHTEIRPALIQRPLHKQ